MNTYTMISVNNVSISGHLLSDPGLTYLEDGRCRLSFLIAHTNRIYDKELNDWIETIPTYVKVSIYGIRAEILAEELRKGSPVYVEGKVLSNNDKDDEDKTKVYILAKKVTHLVRQEGGNNGEDLPF